MKPQTVEFKASIGDRVLIGYARKAATITGLSLSEDDMEPKFFVSMEDNSFDSGWYYSSTLFTAPVATGVPA